MPTAMEVVLLERIESLGAMGDVVRVKPGYARNFLLPQKKALRATKDNIAYFESQREALEKLNAEKKKESEKHSKKLHGLKIILVRHAAEGGQLYGSVSARDIAEAISEQGGQEVGRGQIQLNQGIKTIGLFPVTVALHPEVKVEITVNIARSEEEAKIQAKTGKAVVSEASGGSPAQAELSDDAKKALLDDSALEIEKQSGDEEAEAAKEAASRAEKSAKRAAKKKSKAKPADGEEAAEESDEE
jgi:large subunit ribosomal protein L9